MAEQETIAAALVDALTELTNVAKNHKADTGSYGYSFLNIADLIAETRPVLAEHDMVALTPVHAHGDGLACTVTLLHRSGERLDFGPFPFPRGRDAQATGSMVTYHRRYALLSALGMGAEDDDGKAAQPAAPRQERPPQPPSGITSEALFERLTQFVASRIEDPDGEHAKGAWKAAKPKAVDGVIPDDEVERVMAEADRYLASVTEGGEPF